MLTTIKQLVNSILDYRILRSANQKKKKFRKNIALPVADPGFDRNYRSQWSRLNSRFDRTYPHYCAALNEITDINYVPENIYYGRIEPVLNNKSFALAYADKNFYERYFRDEKLLFPETVVRGINGRIYDREYSLLGKPEETRGLVNQGTDYILKPAVETSGGARVRLLKFKGDAVMIDDQSVSFPEFLQFLRDEYEWNLVLQKRIFPHPWFGDFNASSLNTVRMFTYRSVQDERVHPVQAVVRFGRPGSIVDNQAAGGLTCGITAEGKLNRFAIDKYGKKFLDFDFLAKKKNEMVPGFAEMTEIACRLASRYYFHRLLGFDFCLDDNNQVRLLEINCKNIEINFLQMNNGPLFGAFTDDIINFCASHKKSVVVDFYI